MREAALVPVAEKTSSEDGALTLVPGRRGAEHRHAYRSEGTSAMVAACQEYQKAFKAEHGHLHGSMAAFVRE
eukprot:4736171-Alexandrium_andersonii.AAC.1